MARSRERISAAYVDACRLEIEALKPGNVHLFADGHRMSADQFITSARVSAAPLTDPKLPVGRRILEAVRATRQAVGINTNLGIVLLAAPLACAAGMEGRDLRANLDAVLRAMDMEDASAVFEAIALASPGGLGTAEENDVREEPKVQLLEAMREASGRDRIARQYITGFEDIFEVGLPALEAALSRGESGMWPAIFAYMAFLASFPDSHVARKRGNEVAGGVRNEAAGVRAALDTPDEALRISALLEFDQRLKARDINPGTSADLTVACLLVHILGRRLA
jgi:triphosphoribosyl-dephospho-CoA synthase